MSRQIGCAMLVATLALAAPALAQRNRAQRDPWAGNWRGCSLRHSRHESFSALAALPSSKPAASATPKILRLSMLIPPCWQRPVCAGRSPWLLAVVAASEVVEPIE